MNNKYNRIQAVLSLLFDNNNYCKNKIYTKNVMKEQNNHIEYQKNIKTRKKYLSNFIIREKIKIY